MVLNEDLRISKKSLNHKAESLERIEEEPYQQQAEEEQSLINTSKASLSSRQRDSAKSGGRQNLFAQRKSAQSKKAHQPRQSGRLADERLEQEFEERCYRIIDEEDWEKLEVAAVDQLDQLKGKSARGYFFLGISLYKMEFFDQACLSFQRSSELKADDAQV